MKNLSSSRISTQRKTTTTLSTKKTLRCKLWHPTSGSTMEGNNNNSKRRSIPLTMLSMKISRMKRTKMILKRQMILMKKKRIR
jgi:hypothetical protein